MARAEASPDWPESTSTIPVPARNYRLTSNLTAFSVTAPDRGMVVLHEAWVPDDFIATVNGLPTRLIRVNHAFKGVWVPAAGEYRIEIRYAPSRLRLAFAASAVGALGLLILVLSSLWRRSGQTPA